ncbi:MAG: lipopolysaccharide biosynthesis protein [Candidatus Omnitrophica bacterium]|nr:lipopolysaccharide biosynthesis protein [Candidatus Omnitrophota bacterium]
MGNTENIPKEEPSLKMKAIRSVKWTTMAEVVLKISSMVVTIFLARMLDKEDFGLYALAFVVIDGLGLFKSIGIDKALIQRSEELDKAADTAFLIIPPLGIVLYGTLWLVTPYVANFYPEAADLPQVLRALGFFFVIFTVGKIPLTLLEKDIKFDVIAKITVVSQFFYSIVALSLAFSGFGVWSLVIAYLGTELVRCFMYWRAVPWRPSWTFDKQIASEMFHFGKFVFLSSLIWFLERSFDKIIIPKVIDITTLGVYSIANNLASIPAGFLGVKVSHVLFPTYSKLQGNLYNMKMAFLRVFKVVFMICAPITMGLYLIGGDFLLIAYGSKWVDAVPLVQILAFCGLFHAMGYAKGPILLSLNKPKIGFYLGLIKALILFTTLIPIAKTHGIIGVSWFILVLTIIMFFVGQSITLRLMKVKWSEVLAVLSSTMWACAAMGIVFALTNAYVMGLEVHAIVKFLLNFTIVSAAFGAVIWIKEKEFIWDIKQMVMKS